MDDKTRLELDIENLERYKTPPGIKALLVILIIIVFLLSFHSIMMKELIQKKDARIEMLKEDFNAERKELREKIRGLKEQVSE